MNGNDEVEQEERGEDLEIKADMEYERAKDVIDNPIDEIRAKEKLDEQDKKFIFDFQDSLDRDEERKLRDLSIETKVCAYCGGEVRTYSVGFEGWSVSCIKCDSLFDED